MAITTNTFSVLGNYTRSEVLTQFEDALSWLGWHGDTQTGIVTGISAYGGGGTYTPDIGGNLYRSWFDVRPTSTTGVGTDASFWVERYNGAITRIVVNRPGVGYTNGEYVTLSADDLGGTINGVTGIGITVLVAGGESPIGYGSTTQFYDFDKSGSFPWGVARHTIEPSKRYGDTYRGIQVTSNTNIALSVGNGFHPWDTTNVSDRGNAYDNRFAGAELVDMVPSIFSSSSSSRYVTSTSKSADVVEFSYATNSQYPVDLNLYRSSIDPNFVVFSYKHPTLSSTHLTNNTIATFFFHNFVTNLWDLDNLFLGGYTTIVPNTGNASTPRITFRTYIGGDEGKLRREGGNGYLSFSSSGTLQDNSYVESIYDSVLYPQQPSYNRNYYRSTTDALRSRGGNGTDTGNDSISSDTNFNAVIKGIPLSTSMVPCPYYLPDDFVLIDFDFASPSTNIQEGDTITISGSEVYTVITGSYNQTTRTRGILFCARTI